MDKAILQLFGLKKPDRLAALFFILFFIFAFSLAVSPSAEANFSNNDLLFQRPDCFSSTYFIRVGSVLPLSNAEACGVREGDLIISLGGRSFCPADKPEVGNDFISFLQGLGPGTYELVILRAGQPVSLKFSPHQNAGSVKMGLSWEVVENDPKKYFDQAISILNQASNPEDLKTTVLNFERAKSLSPDWADVYFNLGLIYTKLEYYEEASENLLKYRQLVEPNSPDDLALVRAKDLIEQNKKNLESFRKNLTRMVRGKWRLLKKIPGIDLAGKIEPFPLLEIDRAGNIYLKNPLFKIEKSLGRDSLSELIRKNFKTFPRLPVRFRGRHFEVRWADIYSGEDALGPNQSARFLFPQFWMIQGEINFGVGQELSVRIKEYSKMMHEESYFNRSYEDIYLEAFFKAQSHKFDEAKDLNYEYLFKIE